MTVTRETITCRKCRASGIRNFVRRIEYLQEGGSADSIICLICGDRLASQPVTVKMERAVDHQPANYTYADNPTCAAPGCTRHLYKARAAAGETLCFICARKEILQQVQEIVRVAPLPPGETIRNASWAICAAAACTRRIRPDRTAAGETLCRACASAREDRRSPLWTECASSACTRPLRPSSVVAGHTLCGRCRQYAARQAARKPQEVNHVETISELPRLAPPAPPAPAECHPQSRAPRGRRDSLEGMILFPEENAAELFLLLATIALPTSPAIIASWSPAERAEVSEWATLIDAIKGRNDIRIVPPMPDVLVPIYDASCTERSA